MKDVLYDTHFHYSGTATPVEYCAELPSEYEFRLLAVGGDAAESRRAFDFARAVAFARCAAGVHPHEAEAFDGSLACFNDLAAEAGPLLAAAGELGLDYFYDLAPRARQRAVFETFLGWGLERKLPAIVHCRDAEERFDAYEDVYALLRDFAAAGGRFVVHCFAGTPEWAEKFLALGACLGVTGMVTFKKADNIRSVLRMIPPERLLIETDAPYLAPTPFRGRENHPKYLPEILKRCALELGAGVGELARTTTENAERLFGRTGE